MTETQQLRVGRMQARILVIVSHKSLMLVERNPFCAYLATLAQDSARGCCNDAIQDTN